VSEEASMSEEVIADLERVLETQADIAFAYLFGSFAKGRGRAASDVDVAVWLTSTGDSSGQPEATDRGLELEVLLERMLRRPVQVIVLNRAPIELTHNILRHGRLVFSRAEDVRIRFYVAHARRYYDLASARRLFARYMGRRVQEGTFGGGSGHRP
jgi:uncharacterized protein